MKFGRNISSLHASALAFIVVFFVALISFALFFFTNAGVRFNAYLEVSVKLHVILRLGSVSVIIAVFARCVRFICRFLRVPVSNRNQLSIDVPLSILLSILASFGANAFWEDPLRLPKTALCEHFAGCTAEIIGGFTRFESESNNTGKFRHAIGDPNVRLIDFLLTSEDGVQLHCDATTNLRRRLNADYMVSVSAPGDQHAIEVYLHAEQVVQVTSCSAKGFTDYQHKLTIRDAYYDR